MNDKQSTSFWLALRSLLTILVTIVNEPWRVRVMA